MMRVTANCLYKCRAVICFSTLLALSAAALAEETKTETVQIVKIHVGGDDHFDGTKVIQPPAQFVIRDIRFNPIHSGGDVQYQVISKTPDQATIYWRAASHRIRGPFKMVVDTKTATLELEAIVTFERFAGPINVSQQPPAAAEKSVSLLGAIRILVNKTFVTKLAGYGATLALFVFGIWKTLPDSTKEMIIGAILRRIQASREKKRARKLAKSSA